MAKELSAAVRLAVKKAAFREVANVLVDAVECDGFKHRELPEVPDALYEDTDELFYKEVRILISELKGRAK